MVAVDDNVIFFWTCRYWALVPVPFLIRHAALTLSHHPLVNISSQHRCLVHRRSCKSIGSRTSLYISLASASFVSASQRPGLSAEWDRRSPVVMYRKIRRYVRSYQTYKHLCIVWYGTAWVGRAGQPSLLLPRSQILHALNVISLLTIPFPLLG